VYYDKRTIECNASFLGFSSRSACEEQQGAAHNTHPHPDEKKVTTSSLTTPEFRDEQQGSPLILAYLPNSHDHIRFIHSSLSTTIQAVPSIDLVRPLVRHASYAMCNLNDVSSTIPIAFSVQAMLSSYLHFLNRSLLIQFTCERPPIAQWSGAHALHGSPPARSVATVMLTRPHDSFPIV